MNTCNTLTVSYTPEQYVAIREAALRDAARLRNEAIGELITSIASALRRGTRKVLRLCHIPTPEF